MIPTSLDELVKDSRERVKRLRKTVDKSDNSADFEFLVGSVIREHLEGYDEKVIAYTLKTIFGKD